MIPGSNNGTWGMGMSRGAVFPPNMGGPFGYQGYPLPTLLQHPTGVVGKPYKGHAFGRKFGMVYELTPGGVTTDVGWGFVNKVKSFGIKNKRKSKNNKKSANKSKRKIKSNRRSFKKYTKVVKFKLPCIGGCGKYIKVIRGSKNICSKCINHTF